MPQYSKIFRLSVLSACLAFPTFAMAQDICLRTGKNIVGDPIVMQLKWPIDPDAPPPLLARPEAPSEPEAADPLGNLFAGTSATDGAAVPCDSGSISQAISCMTEDIKNANQPLTPLEAEAELAAESSQTSNSTNTAETANEANEDETPATSPEAEQDLTRYVYGSITLRPIYIQGEPMRVRMATSNTSVQADLSRVTPEAARRIKGDLDKISSAMKTWSTTLGSEDVTDMAEGRSFWSLEMMAIPQIERSEKSELKVSDKLTLPPGCASLFLMQEEAGRRAEDVSEARRRLARLRERRKAEKDSDRQSKLDTQIKIAENRVRKLAEPLLTLEKRIRAEETRLSEAQHEKEIAAIKKDPKLVKAANDARLNEATKAYRDYRQYEKTRAAGIDEYRKGLRDYDAKIAAAPDDATRDGYIEAKERYQRLHEQYEEQSRRTAGTRFRDLDRALRQNKADGLGPTSIPEILAQLEAAGGDPVEIIEKTEEGRLERARKIAKSDQTTLGGTASRNSGLLQGYKDTAVALVEEREKVILTPSDMVQKLQDIADGKTTLKEVVDDQTNFAARLGRYGKGAIVGTGKGIIGLGELGYNGLTYALEQDEAMLEATLSGFAGRKVEIDYFGDRKTKAVAKALVSGGESIDKLLDTSGTRHGVRGGDRVDFDDVWDDPSKVGDFLLQTGDEFSRSVSTATDRITNPVGKALDNKLAKITRGGEKELRATLESGGEIVGEVSDVGLAALWAARGLKKGSEALDALSDGSAVARATEKIDSASDASKAARVSSAADEAKAISNLENGTGLPVVPPASNSAKLDEINKIAEAAPQPKSNAPAIDTPNSKPQAATQASDARLAETTDLPAAQADPRLAETVNPSTNLSKSDAGSSASQASDARLAETTDLPAAQADPRLAETVNPSTNLSKSDAGSSASQASDARLAETTDLPAAQADPRLAETVNPSTNLSKSDAGSSASQASDARLAETTDLPAAQADPRLAETVNPSTNLSKSDAGSSASQASDARLAETTDLPATQSDPRLAETVDPSANLSKSDAGSGSVANSNSTPSNADEFAGTQALDNAESARASQVRVNDKVDNSAVYAKTDPLPAPKAESANAGQVNGNKIDNSAAHAKTGPVAAAEESGGTFGNMAGLDSASDAGKSPFDVADDFGPPGPGPALPPPPREYDLARAADRAELIRVSQKAPPTKAERFASDASPYKDPMTPTATEMKPLSGRAQTQEGRRAVLNSRDEAAGLDIVATRPDGSTETLRVGEQLGKGSYSSVYRRRNPDGSLADDVIRITPVEAGKESAFAAETASRRILQTAEKESTYFRSAARPDEAKNFSITEIDGKKYMITREESIVDAQRAFQKRVGNKAGPDSPEADALQKLTMELAIRDLNARGLAFTDHKLENIALVKADTPTGYEVVMFDTGGIVPMRGADDATRAANARRLQQEFDRPYLENSVVPSNQVTPKQAARARTNADVRLVDQSHVDSLLDERAYGAAYNPDYVGGGAAPFTRLGNRGRDTYFELTRMSNAQLKDHIQNNQAIQKLLKDQGKSVDDLVNTLP